MEIIDLSETTFDGYTLETFEDSKYCATTLLMQWNERTGSTKTMAAYMRNSATREFIKEQPLAESDMILVEKIKSEWGRSLEKVWLHPYVFVHFVSWLMPKYSIRISEYVFKREMLKENANSILNHLYDSMYGFPKWDIGLFSQHLNLALHDNTHNFNCNIALNFELERMIRVCENLIFIIKNKMVVDFESLLNLIDTIRKQDFK